ncbi:MAG TPA: biopolymer transporter ExbD [Polyangiaceae bacterium]|nr:biopolymer transporter ExbD [Polyangiaceae bacterium]
MATLDLGGGGSGRRELNHELPLVPFIDFLLCIVAFLLVTAVWSQMARLDANAKVPTNTGEAPAEPTPELHVDMRPHDKFVLTWRQGGTVLAQEETPRVRSPAAEGGGVRYPELSRRLETSWATRGVHRAPADLRRDRAVLHASNDAAFEEIVGAMDAIAGVRRAAANGRGAAAFDVVFAAD